MIKRRNLFTLLSCLVIGILLIFTSSVSAQTDEMVRVINLSNSGFEQARSVSFSPDGNLLAIGGTSGIYLYDFQKLSLIDFIQTNTWARSVAFLTTDNTLAAGLFDNTIKFWSIPEIQLTGTLDGPQGWVRSISLSRDSSLIASASDDNTVRVWRVREDAPMLVIDNNTTGVRAVSLSPDGTLVAGALGDKTVRVWKVSNGELLYTLNGHEDWVRCLAFSPDGQLLASGSFDKTIRLWNMSSGELQQTLMGHTSSVLGVAFSPDGKTLASGSVDETVRLWNVSDGSPVRVLQGHGNFVYTVAFSPDGKTLASGSGDNTVRLWDLETLEKTAADSTIPNISTPSDCRACHHRRGQVEPARVIELSCENCHAGGIGLSWCTGFARSSYVESGPVHFSYVEDISGVPVDNRNIAVVIASPGNGETLYVRGNYMAPEFISGKVFYTDRATLSKVEVRLDLISDGQTTTSLVTAPNENGEFLFNLAINPNSPPPHLSRPGTRQCLMCHGDFVPEAGLPKGDVQVVVTAKTPDGQQAVDDRWIHVDVSKTNSVPVQVIDEGTQEPLSGLSVDASTILYEWRDRFGSATTDINGEANLNLDTLTQKDTTYSVSIPPQVLNGILYASLKPAELKLKPSASTPTLTLTAHALSGRINGELGGAASLPEIKVWAIQLPAGPAHQAALTEDNMFEFDRIPVSKYLVAPDALMLAKQNLYTTSHSIDLFESPMVNMSFSLEKGRPVYGKVIGKNNAALPFAWANIGNSGSIQAIDPVSSEFVIPNFPSNVSYVTVSAPGYYSLPQSIKTSTKELEYQLVPRPETSFVQWGDGQVVLPPETKEMGNGLKFDLEYGWIWGRNMSPQPLQIHISGVDIQLSSGQFALENPVEGTGWLYLYQGQAEVIYSGGQAPVKLESGQMIAIVDSAQAFPMESAVTVVLHPNLAELPVFEIIEPSLSARVQSWLVKTGIGAMQTITFITYILSLVTLIAIPLIVLFSYGKKRRNLSDSQEKH